MVTTSRLPYLFVPLSPDSRPLTRATDETLTRLTKSTHMYLCHAISFMKYHVSDLERFPILPEVILFSEFEFSFFDFSRI